MQVPGERHSRSKHMVDQELELFVHGQGRKPQVVRAAAHEILKDVLIRVGLLKEGEDDVLVFVGESEEALTEPDEVEDGVDQHAPSAELC
jgi:hypothetical protein